MISVTLRGWGDCGVTRKLASQYPDITWVEVYIPNYDDIKRSVEAVVDIVNMFDGFLFTGGWQSDSTAECVFHVATALGKAIYTENDYPLSEEEKDGENNA